MSNGFIYVAQQAANALQLGGFYVLLASAYVIVHGAIRRFNLAFGAVAAWAGTMAAGAAIALFDRVFWPPALILAAGLAIGTLCGALAAQAVGLYAVAPIRNAPRLSVMVATLGAAIALEEAMRIATGNEAIWLPPALLPVVLTGTFDLAEGVAISRAGAFSFLAALGIAGCLALFMKKSGFGRLWRANAEDPQMAELLGVDTRRVFLVSSLIAGFAAALTGVLIVLRYGNMNFYDGFMINAKALFVAVLGGLGSFGGIFVAGMALALFETGWSAFAPLLYRDVAVFSLLVLLLALRPRTAV